MAQSCAPNEISYTATGKVQSWGYVKRGQEKLDHLDRLLWNTSPPDEIRKLIPHTKEPAEIIIDYLSCLRKHFLEVIGASLGKAFLNLTPIDWVFTVPNV